MVITGAGGGIMAAGHAGAGHEPSFGLAISLPFEQQTNPHIERDPKLINFNYFFTRKLMFVRSSHAVVIFPGGFGTMDEGFEVLTLVQTGKSVPDPDRVRRPEGRRLLGHVAGLRRAAAAGPRADRARTTWPCTRSPTTSTRPSTSAGTSTATTTACGTPRATPSSACTGPPTPRSWPRSTTASRTSTRHGGFRLSDALPVERDEPALADLPRLVFNFNKRDHGRLRMLIDYLNDLPA